MWGPATTAAQLPQQQSRARCRACARACSSDPPRLPMRRGRAVAVAANVHRAAAAAAESLGQERREARTKASSSGNGGEGGYVPTSAPWLTEQHQHPHQHQQRYQQQQQRWRHRGNDHDLSAANHHRQQPQQQQQPRRSSGSGSGSSSPLLATTAATAAALAATAAAAPGAASAAEALPPSLLDAFTAFLEQVHALGPWGAVLFVATVALAEMVPLFPTQPLSLASGLLFGAKQGALLMLLGVTLAGLGAFTVARGVGRPLAERIIRAETGHGTAGDGGDGKGGGFGSAWASVEAAIESGGFVRQLTAITLLRLTPVIPYSATNYLLGLTPVQPAAFVLGTLAGMSVWATLYAGLGGASRALLDTGADLELLLADLGDKAGQYSADVAAVGLAVAGVGLAAWLWRRSSSSGGDGGGGGGPGLPLPGASQQQQRQPPRVAERSAAASAEEREGEGVLTRQ